jgi:transcriptional regulator with XRE-family HTH domain
MPPRKNLSKPRPIKAFDEPPNRIAEIRSARGMTQQDLADLADTSNQQIGHLESGARRLTDKWMARLAPHLGVPASALMRGGGSEVQPVVTQAGNAGVDHDMLRRSIKAALVFFEVSETDASKIAAKAIQIYQSELVSSGSAD